ncbi:MAG TPA: hypothetical protein VGX37_05805, partial [Allosphingosinicella sp.]|nr:hypothetical protein [Allosphingosinicella sp.]
MRPSILLAAFTLAACATTGTPPPERQTGERSWSAEEARAIVERDVRTVLGPAALEEARRASASVLVRRGISLPRMIQQPNGSWEPEP